MGPREIKRNFLKTDEFTCKAWQRLVKVEQHSDVCLSHRVFLSVRILEINKDVKQPFERVSVSLTIMLVYINYQKTKTALL